MILVGVVGGGLAITHATDTDWLTHMSLSGLGLDTGASGILNGTLVALGLILVALAISLEGSFAGLCSAARLSRTRIRVKCSTARLACYPEPVTR